MASTRADRRADLTNRYLIGTGLAGVFVVGGGGRTPSLMIATDVAAAVRQLERTPDVLVLARMWFSNAAVAVAVFERAVEIAGRAPVRSGDEAFDLSEFVRSAADVLGAEVRDDQVVAAQCAAAVAEIERAVDASRTDGGLRDVNAAFKQHRSEMGEQALSYEDWLHRYKVKAVEAAAARLRSAMRSSTV